MEAKQSLKSIIQERIDILLNAAISCMKRKEYYYAKRYVFLARKLAMRYNVRMSKSQKALFCKSCGMPSIPGFNLKVRLRKRKKSAEYLCSCGAKRSFKYRI
ncbi:MAG: ribonuclease P Rpr2/Rpp21/SNM1 subunit [Candidatus Anstonellaceae archaeon]